MLSITERDYQRMRDAVFFEGDARRRRMSRFWGLLVLAAVIATAGVISDSTATVIGAMIVAPLMVPILGAVFAIVIGSRPNLVRSVLLIVAGAAAVVVVAYLIGVAVPIDVLAPSNTQVSGRVNPRFIDFVAALATGAVGAFALVRDDVADTLPGVAIAISLVPPLAVVGLTLEAGSGDQARGALLLFLTNVAAILVTGVAVMTVYRVRRTSQAISIALAADDGPAIRSRYPVFLVVALALVIALPLIGASRRLTSSTLETERIASVAEDWVRDSEWQIVQVQYRDGRVVVRALGPPPSPPPAALRRMLDRAGHAGTDVALELVPEERVDLPGR
ncbi:MAG: DUF389 domain-containing protein [Actinobacteria bacterium]|nr:DUF389 domain-containing protein [Actinomycetota bacterium]